MNEGKLKKLIEQVMISNFNSDVGDGYTSPSELFKIIDKAKKEIPSMILGQPAVFGVDDTEFGKGYEKGYYHARETVYKWFKKWMGIEEK